MRFEHPDVIIVGSGPAGVSAAWPLVRAGLRVLMLDAGAVRPFPAAPSGDITAFRGDADRWKAQFGQDLAGLAPGGDVSPKLSTPLARDVLSGYAARLGVHTKDFLALGSLATGGLSNIWGAVAAPYTARDLARFPISLAELAPSYAAVMQRIGVSGGDPGGAGPTLTPPVLTPPVRTIFEAYVRRAPAPGFHLERTRNAVLMQDRDDRQGCVQCGLCLWGCARGSIYASRFELPALAQYNNFHYRPAALVHRVDAAAAGHAVLVNAATAPETIHAPHVILAAGTIATTALAMRRLGRVGAARRLLTNPVAAMAFLVPRHIGADLPGRSFALGQLSHELALPDDEACAGIIYGADTLPLDEVARRLPLTRPVALRFSRAVAPALVLATLYLPGRHSRNSLRVDAAGGTAAIQLDGEMPAPTQALLLACASRLARAMRRLGAYALPGSLAISQPGADAHYAGTLPMGDSTGVGCSTAGELNGAPGVYVVDGAALSDLPAKHCTLTIMANADRIAHGLVERVRRPR